MGAPAVRTGCLRALCGLVIIAVVHAAAPRSFHRTPKNVADGYFAGRSGSVVIAPKPLKAPDGVFGITGPSQYISKAPQGSNTALQWSDAAHVVAGSMGLGSSLPEAARSIVKHSLIDMPPANMLWLIPGLGTEALQSMGLPALQAFFDEAQTFTLSDGPYPHAPLSMATTVATGATASKHGIVGDSWATYGARERAFSCLATQSMHTNVAELFSQTFRGRGLTVSASADAQFAAAGGVEAGQESSSDIVLSLSDKIQAFTRRGLASAFGPSMTTESVVQSIRGGRIGQTSKTIWQELEVTGVTVTANDDNTISVATGDDVVVFSESQLFVFKELLFLSELPASLQLDASVAPLLNDDVPDYYHLTISALNTLAASDDCRHGQCAAFVSAAKLVDAALPVLMDRFNVMYSQLAVSEVALLGTPTKTTSETEQAVAAAIDRVATELQVQGIVPGSQSTLAVNLGHEALTVFCERVNTELNELGFQALCPPLDPDLSSFLDVSATFGRMRIQTNANPTNDTVTFADQSRYQIILWLVIILVLVVYAAAYSIATMEFKRDPLLYSKFNPNWNARK